MKIIKNKKKNNLLFFLFFYFLSITIANAEIYNEIKVSGNERLSVETIINVFWIKNW